jgi:hypothetical protein
VTRADFQAQTIMEQQRRIRQSMNSTPVELRACLSQYAGVVAVKISANCDAGLPDEIERAVFDTSRQACPGKYGRAFGIPTDVVRSISSWDEVLRIIGAPASGSVEAEAEKAKRERQRPSEMKCRTNPTTGTLECSK